MSTTLAQRLRQLRGEMPQAEFAVRVGIHKSSWGRYERGVGEPTASDLARLCAVCGTDPSWLLYGEDHMRAEDGGPTGPDTAPDSQEAEPTCLPASRDDDDARAAADSLTLEAAPQIPESPVKAERDEAFPCRQCRWLEARLEQADRERREMTQENRQLWRENSELRERVARLEERLGKERGT